MHEGFKMCTIDNSIFVSTNEKKITILVIYVDDIILVGNDLENIKQTKRMLRNHFEMKDLGKQSYFLRIEVVHSKKEIYTCQEKYVLDILNDISMLKCKGANTPIEGGI